ncbi:unnamed protein product [Durusdinium trenchii]|uniref:SH3 domain-containing protein n=2 Tax=Durusdinium trenchii TaxID=1381693 RepID=A0ABP0KZB4_9DINO
MRTIGGSPTDKPQRGNSGRPQEDKSVTHQRIMRDGTVEDFVEKMKQVFGNEHGDFQTFPAEKKAIWTQKSSQTNVEFREPNHTVYVTGKEGSVRQILAVLGQFLESVPEGYTGVETSSRVHTRSFIGSKAPSKVFEGGSLMAARTKPTSVTALSIANKPKSASTTNGVKQVPYRRKVTQDCESEGSGELELKVGEIITVQEDPDAPEGDLDRWVFGKKEKTGETGWFALGYTRDTEE